MNPRRFSFVVLTAIMLVAAGCSKRAPEAKPAPKPVAEAAKPSPQPAAAKPSAPKPAPVPEPEPKPVPDVLFSLRGLDSGQLANDRPLFVGVRVESSVDKEAALTLAPATGRWSDGVKVELTAAGAPEKVLLQAQRTDGAGEAAAATLGTAQAAEGTWLFPSAEIAQLAPGDYQVQVKLGIADGTGWHGNVTGEPAAFKLVAAAAAVTPAQQAERALALAGEAMLAKDWPKAAAILDERLAADPDNIDLLKTRAMLCLEGGNPLAANVCANRAWARVMRERWEHPPADLHVLNQVVMAAMTKAPAGPPTPLPAWSMPPAVVLAPLPEPNAPSK
jgi:hypothetical protein